MPSKVSFPDEVRHHYQGAMSVANAAVRKGEHVKAAMYMERAAAFMQTRAMYYDKRQGEHMTAANARSEARRLQEQADLAAAFAQGDPNVSVMPGVSHWGYMRHHAFEPMARAEHLCHVCTYHADQPIHTVQAVVS